MEQRDRQYPAGGITLPAESETDAIVYLQGDELSPWYREGQAVEVEFRPPEEGECAIWRLKDGRVLVRQLCYDRDGGVMLLTAGRDRPDATLCFARDEVQVCAVLKKSRRRLPFRIGEDGCRLMGNREE